MTTRIELTRALEAQGFMFTHDEFGDDPNGPCMYITWAKAYNIVTSLMNDSMPLGPELLMGWHFNDTYLHISTMGAEFIIDNIAKYSTEQAAECVARFVSGTYFMSGMLPSLDADEPYTHVRDYPHYN